MSSRTSPIFFINEFATVWDVTFQNHFHFGFAKPFRKISEHKTKLFLKNKMKNRDSKMGLKMARHFQKMGHFWTFLQLKIFTRSSFVKWEMLRWCSSWRHSILLIFLPRIALMPTLGNDKLPLSSGPMKFWSTIAVSNYRLSIYQNDANTASRNVSSGVNPTMFFTLLQLSQNAQHCDTVVMEYGEIDRFP